MYYNWNATIDQPTEPINNSLLFLLVLSLCCWLLLVVLGCHSTALNHDQQASSIHTFCLPYERLLNTTFVCAYRINRRSKPSTNHYQSVSTSTPPDQAATCYQLLQRPRAIRWCGKAFNYDTCHTQLTKND